MLSRVYSIMAARRTQGWSAGPDYSSIAVNVRFGSHQTMYELDRAFTVGELRQKLSADHNIPLPEVKVVLAGSVLADDLTIEESGVGMQSMLFAIRTKPSATTQATRGITTSVSDSQTAPAAVPATTSNTTAGGSCEVRPGRLRVKCSVCGDGAVLVERGPGSWADVLTPGRVTGKCQSLHCEDCKPVFYFKCVEDHQGSVDGTAVALYHIRPNRRCVECITCADVLSPVVVFPCQASHVMCLHCFMEYCKVRLHERGFVQREQYGYTLPCPAGCADSYIQEQHHFCIMGCTEYERYKDFAAEECLLAAGGVYCPRSGCGQPFMVDTPGPRVVCPQCHFVFCRNCQGAVHEGDCSFQTRSSESSQDFSDPERAERAQWERQTAQTIEVTTKGCPGCGTRTERDGGCMHMVCFRCGEEWCWLCVKAWDRVCQSSHWFG
ncbi:hypothetical protein BaRGS_00015606 [Batillaria attramentaria]|uniref:E3 ubiquitin-protein ligase parkin n=1 Tax=Batillaria attramentaria TaxID=370345 RepID=A0ABD0L0W3_9CAEN